MNDRYDPGYGAYDQYELVGYDEYGRPVYRQAPAAARPHTPADRTTRTQQQGSSRQARGYGYDPYATDRRSSPTAAYATQRHRPAAAQLPAMTASGYDPVRATGSAEHGTAPRRPLRPGRGRRGRPQQPRVAEQTAYIPQQARPADDEDAPARDAGPWDDAHPDDAQRDDRDYRTEQFAFVEEPDGDSEDVIDWLKFTENRTERREEARRRARSRLIALAVVLALVAAWAVLGWLWYAGKLPGLSSVRRQDRQRRRRGRPEAGRDRRPPARHQGRRHLHRPAGRQHHHQAGHDRPAAQLPRP
ncbi:Membrane protein OS=Streptomyces fumanus OX=67302 GN=GCM10018772_03590 PE=3 SV=1 [Streptomyces fumanus]